MVGEGVPAAVVGRGSAMSGVGRPFLVKERRGRGEIGPSRCRLLVVQRRIPRAVQGWAVGGGVVVAGRGGGGAAGMRFGIPRKSKMWVVSVKVGF